MSSWAPPGPILTPPFRYRANFPEYAVPGDYFDQNVPQVGSPFPYSVAVSCGGSPNASALDYTYGINGDNTAAPWTINLTYNLGSAGN
jgi:hypothetical protein